MKKTCVRVFSSKTTETARTATNYGKPGSRSGGDRCPMQLVTRQFGKATWSIPSPDSRPQPLMFPAFSPSPTVSHLKPTYIYIYVFKTSPSSLTCFNFPNSPRNHPPHIPIFLVVTSTPSAFPRSVFSAMADTASAASFSAMLSFLPGPRPQAQLSQLQMRRLLLT